MQFYIQSIVWLLLVIVCPSPIALAEDASTTRSTVSRTSSVSSQANNQTSPSAPTASTSRLVQAATPTSSSTDNCTTPVRVSNQFDIPGLTGWDLTSHFDYFNNSASEHEHNLNCQWRIPRREGLQTLIRITRLALESSPTCNYDTLTLEYVDINTNYPISQNYCGSIDSKIILAASEVTVTFKTDASVNYRGFHLQWAYVNASLAEDIKNLSASSLCTKPQSLDMVTIGGISAPGERLVSHDDISMDLLVPPSLYRHNQRCNWTLPMRKRYILLWVRFVQLEFSREVSPMQRCNYDNLTVSFSDAITGRLFRLTMCALTQDLTFLANSSIEVTFRTDSSVGSRGFSIEWLHLNESQADLLRESWSSFSNTTQSSCTTPEALPNVTVGSNGFFTGGQLVSHAEYLTVGSSKYQPNMNCKWTIEIPDNQTLIHFQVVSLDLETSSVSSSECRFDNLTVEYTDVLTNRFVSKVACRSLHLSYFTSKSSVIVKFVTDRSVSKRGFHLVWYFVPLQYVYQLPGLDRMQSFNCPEIQSTDRFREISIDLSHPNIRCSWRLTINDGETMNISAIYDNISDESVPAISATPFGLCCLSTRKLLSVALVSQSGNAVAFCLCNNQANSFSATAYSGPVSIMLRTTGQSVSSGRVRISYKRQEDPVHTNCSVVQIINKYKGKISDTISMIKTTQCQWIINPLDENHAVKVKVIQKDLRHRFQYGDSRYLYRSRIIDVTAPDCSCKIALFTNKSIGPERIKNWTIAIQSDSASAADAMLGNSPKLVRMCCGRQQMLPWSPAAFDGIDEVTSWGRVSISLEFDRQPMIDLAYVIELRHFPIAKPGSARLCRPKPAVATNNSVLEEATGGRLVSVKQVTVKSGSDCLTSALMSTNPHENAGNGDWINISVSCAQSHGRIHILMDNLTVHSVQCPQGSIYYHWLDQIPVTIDAVNTGGFTAVIQHVTLVLDMSLVSILCPSYEPSRSTWKAYLPLYWTAGDLSLNRMKMVYCQIVLIPPPGHELIVQLQTPIHNEMQDDFCLYLSSLHYQPKLSFIISSPLRQDELKLALCDHNLPGGLRLQDRVRVVEGVSLTIDLTIATRRSNPNRTGISATTNQSNDAGYEVEPFNTYKELDAFVIVEQVETCQRLPSSAENWHLSEDGTQLLSSVTVAPANTQTECKLQLDALTAAQIVNHTKLNGAGLSNPSTDDCWSLVVQLDKFSAVCGLKQLVLTVSHWDSLAGSIDHSQREICGSDSSFSWSTVASLQAAGSGMSLWYSGLRSGFTARFSISACKRISDRSDKLVDSSAIKGSVSPVLIGVLIALALCNVLVVLFLFRTRITECARAAASRAPPTHRQLIYRTGADGVNLINEDT